MNLIKTILKQIADKSIESRKSSINHLSGMKSVFSRARSKQEYSN